ncbi:hypothetical protein [Salinarimonas chemoclinalis]|uniref:hypothetical protein n=1 Tax=Salinarimonas chemoclinalis TaxID=3241599 RepID=UPI00355674E4
MRTLVLAAALALATSALADPRPAQPDPIASFEHRFGYKSIFWCAETVEEHMGALAEAGASGRALPAIVFDAAAYCLARHFPAATHRECEETLYALSQLDVLYPGFLQQEMALAVMGECRAFLR